MTRLRHIARRVTLTFAASFATLTVALVAITGWPPTPHRVGAALLAGVHSRFVFRGPQAEWWGDLVRTAWVRGDRAYVALGTRMGVLDVSDPTSPRLVTAVSAGGIVHGFASSGDVLCVAHGVNGMSSWNVADLDHPVRLGVFVADGYGMGVTVAGHYVVYAAQDDGWYVLDIADPRDPRPVFHEPGGSVSATTLAAGLLYVADGARGVVIWDFQDPTHPVKLGAIDVAIHGDLAPLDPAPLWVAVQDTIAYVANGPRGLVVLDVADPRSPRQVVEMPLDGYTYGVMLDGDRGYLADIGRGLITLDLTEPRAPRIIEITPTPGGAFDLTARGRHLFVSDGASGFAVFDLADRDRPEPVGYFPIAGVTRNVFLDGDRLITSQGSLGVAIYDVSAPSRPRLIAGLDTHGLANDVVVRSDLVYVADVLGGVQVAGPDATGGFGIRDTFNLENHPWSVVADHRYLYVANAHYGFMVFDLSQTPPSLIGQERSIGGYSVSLAQCGSRFVISNLVRGIAVVDAGNPAHPQLTTIHPPARSIWHQLVHGIPTVIRARVRDGHAFLASYSRGLEIVDLRDPGAIAEVGRLETGGYVYGLDLEGDLAFLADYNGRLIVADISDLAHPRKLREYRMPAGEAWNVAVRSRTAYVALGTAGLGVVDLDTGHTSILAHPDPTRGSKAEAHTPP